MQYSDLVLQVQTVVNQQRALGMKIWLEGQNEPEKTAYFKVI
jgi:hypothetical protein